jgi:hypothetical protein
MDPARFDNLSRALVVAASRRGLTRILAGLTAGFVVAPGIGPISVEAKKKKKSKEKLCRQHYGGPYCPANKRIGFYVPCCTSIEVCTECGCCEEGFANCCLSPTDPILSTCCADNTSCCVTTSGETECCQPDEFCCGNGCCAVGNQCCGGEVCCHFSRTCEGAICN